MNILALDTTGAALDLAVLAGIKTFKTRRTAVSPHDETLLPQIDKLLARAKLKLSDLDAVAVAGGPGRFTGIRIGMAYAAIASLKMKIPALAISRFEAAAFKTPGRLVCAAFPGFREEYFYQLYQRSAAGALKPKAAPVWATPDRWREANAELKRLGAIFSDENVAAADLLIPAAERLKRGRIPKFEPLYLKPAGYEAKRKAGPAR